MVYRIYVEKKPDCAVEAAGVLADLRTALCMEQVESVRVINRYDAEGLSAQDFDSLWNICPASTTSVPTRPPSASRS